MNDHFSAIELDIKVGIWVNKARKSKNHFKTRSITDKEKELSSKYFNDLYFSKFQKECNSLKGDFGISIEHTSTKGNSERQLKIKNRLPAEILSEGEQKIIALADFLAEVNINIHNKGIIFDDPVTSLDNDRKDTIAKRLTEESLNRQIIIFTHDISFVSHLITHCNNSNIEPDCHWIERNQEYAGTVFLKNFPSYERSYRNEKIASEYHIKAKTSDPSQSEYLIKNGFAALRTSYETMVAFDLFNNVITRFGDRISMESLKDVPIDSSIRTEVLDSFAHCCRHMEGHSHSDTFTYKKPEVEDLNSEIQRFIGIRKKIKVLKEQNKI